MKITLNKLSLGLSGGILWSLGFFILTLISIATGYANNILLLFIELYPGYSFDIIGIIIGMIYAFIDAFIGLYIFAWLYNYFEKKFKSNKQ